MSNETKVNRNESFDSLSCDFLVGELEGTRLGTDSPTPQMSEFRKREMRGEIVEPLLVADPGRFVLFPIRHHDVSTIILRINHYYTHLDFEN
jgi:hypothetical protein